MPKEDLLSQEVLQQKRALTLAWSAAAGLLFLAVAAVWQWTRAVEQTNVATQERARAEEQRQRADEQRDLAVGAQAQAERERDRARESLLVAAGRQSLLLTRDHRPEQAWTALTDVLSELKADRATPLPALFLEAGLTALIEDRTGPEMVLTRGERTKTLADPGNRSDRFAASVVAAFDPKSDRVAAGRDFDAAIWSTRNLQQLARYQMRYPISSLAFNQAGDILIVIQESKEDGAFVTLIEPATARFRTLPLQDCLGLVKCLAERPKVPQKLVDIRQQDGLAKILEAGSKPPALLVEPDLPIMLKRYYAIAQEDRDRITIAVLDIQTGAVARLVPKEDASWRITVAKDQPLMVLSAGDNNRLDVYRLEIDPRNASRLAIRPVKELEARDSVATKDVALSDDGRLLYYSNSAGGASGGGRGAIIAAIIDVPSGVETWSDPFDGNTRYGPRQDFFARSSEELNRRTVRTSFADGRTQQEKLSVPGAFVAFDLRGEMALVESVSTADGATGAEAAESARLRLVELSKLTSLSNEPREPRAVAKPCRLDGRPFKTLSDRMDRLWNGNDWYRRPLAGLQGTPLDRLEHRTKFVQLRWAKDEVTVLGQDGTVLARGAADEVAKQRPDLAEPISQHANMWLTEFASPDGRWLAVIRETNISDEQEEVDWKLYRVAGGDRTLFKSGTATGESFDEAAIFFLEHAPVAAIRDGACSVTLWSLEDGRKLGQITPNSVPEGPPQAGGRRYHRGLRVRRLRRGRQRAGVQLSRPARRTLAAGLERLRDGGRPGRRRGCTAHPAVVTPSRDAGDRRERTLPDRATGQGRRRAHRAVGPTLGPPPA